MATKVNINGINELDIVGIINPTTSQGVTSFAIPNTFNLIKRTASYPAVAGDFILADTSGGGFTITLPLASANDSGKISIAKISNDGNALTIAISGSDTIDGDTSKTIVLYNVSMDLIGYAAGSLWKIY